MRPVPRYTFTLYREVQGAAPGDGEGTIDLHHIVLQVYDDELVPGRVCLQYHIALAGHAEVEEPLLARHSAAQGAAGHGLQLDAALGCGEESVLDHHAAAPFGEVLYQVVFVAGLCHQQAGALVLRLDAGLSRDGTAHGLSEEISHALHTGGELDVPGEPLHGAGLEDHRLFVQGAEDLLLLHAHLGHVPLYLGVVRGAGQIPAVLDDLEGAALFAHLHFRVVYEVVYVDQLKYLLRGLYSGAPAGRSAGLQYTGIRTKMQ